MIRTAATLVAAVALVVAAAALVVSARSAYRVAEAEEEQACWAWISATALAGRVTVLAADTYDANYLKMRDVCKAL